MKTITVVAEDRVGLLADISYLLGKAKINIESLSVDVIGGKTIISLTLKDTDKAKEALINAGFTVEEPDITLIKLTDQPGELGKITQMLAKEKVNIENVHIVSRNGSETIISLKVDKPRKATKVLESYLVTKNQPS